ncbi:MAG: hypothetical protein EPN93_01650 [Spirochaetes bacterium]|nr:MAG: hypothetical protein EPN93_01650 [Spirochaetota bacterium]
MVRQLCAAIITLVTVITLTPLRAQDAVGKDDKGKSESRIPIQSRFSSDFKITENYFNRRIDSGGAGDVLEVELIIQNLTDKPQDLYIFAVATTEKVEKTKSSFERPIPEKEKMRSFVPYPENMANFEYDVPEKSGSKSLIAYPKNPREGIDPSTGKPYTLKVNDKLVVRTYHLSRYRKDFKFFNFLTVIIFNSEGNPVFKQKYEIEGVRR